MTYADLSDDQKATLTLVGISSDADLNAVKERISTDRKAAAIQTIVDQYDLLFQQKQVEIDALKAAKAAAIAAVV